MASAPLAWEIKPENLKNTKTLLGDGRCSRVYLAKLTQENGGVIDVAAKVLNNGHVNSKELTTLHKLSIHPHRNIIKFHGAVRSTGDNTTTIVTELARNESLYDYLQKMKEANKRLATKRVLTWALDGALAIQHLHDHDIMHRDIKSPNFLIMDDRSMTMKLCDFGISIPDGSCTQSTDNARGTLRWKAPELFENEVSRRSDIFSFGTVLWEIIMCEIPYPQYKGDAKLMRTILSDEKLSPVPDEYPADLQQMIHDCRAFDKEDRPTIESVIQRLTILLQQHVEEGKYVGVIQKSLSPFRRRRTHQYDYFLNKKINQ